MIPQIKAGTANTRKKLVNPFIGKDSRNNVAVSDAGKILIIHPVKYLAIACVDWNIPKNSAKLLAGASSATIA